MVAIQISQIATGVLLLARLGYAAPAEAAVQQEAAVAGRTQPPYDDPSPTLTTALYSCFVFRCTANSLFLSLVFSMLHLHGLHVLLWCGSMLLEKFEGVQICSTLLALLERVLHLKPAKVVSYQVSSHE